MCTIISVAYWKCLIGRCAGHDGEIPSPGRYAADLSPSGRGEAASNSRNACFHYGSQTSSTRLPQLTFPLPHRGHTDIDGSEEHADKCADEIDPLFFFQHRTGHQKPHFQEIGNVGDANSDQHPADNLLPVDQMRLPRCSATDVRSLSPRPDMLSTIR